MTEIKLISDITVTPIRAEGGDKEFVAAARVSSLGADLEAAQNPKGYKGTLRALIGQKHGTPIEHGWLSFYVHAPIFVTREIIRHRIGVSPNEESGRYKELEPVFWVPRFERPMLKASDHKPMRPKAAPLGDRDLYDDMMMSSTEAYENAWDAYTWELQCGILPEVARRHLPLSIYSSMRLSFNPRSLMHFLSLRVHAPRSPRAVLRWLISNTPDDKEGPNMWIRHHLEEAYNEISSEDPWEPGDPWALFPSYPQAEIQEVALACEEILKTGWPVSYQAFIDNGRVAP
jgi:thymidylate synthase (FAD)